MISPHSSLLQACHITKFQFEQRFKEIRRHSPDLMFLVLEGCKIEDIKMYALLHIWGPKN